MKRALLSVTDKTGIVEFARGLVELGFQVLSTGGTARTLRESGIDVTDVSEVTQFPEALDGRIKTLHPLIHGGLLGDVRVAEHREQMERLGISPIAVLGVNLYAFEKTVTHDHTSEEAIESIDIGGPAMIRAAAKNAANVSVVVDPADYGVVLDAIRSQTEANLRPKLAAKAFRHTAFYDSMIARYLSVAAGEAFPETLTLGYRLALPLRYGENPHQSGALYRDPLARGGIAYAQSLWGKELSYNNLLDADGAWELVADLPEGACAIIKHGNPCGAALAPTLGESYRLARASDPVSAFGGIAAFHGSVDLEAAQSMTEKGNFLEVVIAKSFSQEAIDVFRNRSGWGQDVRLLSAEFADGRGLKALRSIRGGVLVQDIDEDPGGEWEVVTDRSPTEAQMKAFQFQWAIVQHVKSNAIVVGDDHRLLGIGAGQMNRVHSVRLALEQAGDGAKGAVLASDAFFPFPDSVEAAGRAGIAAIIQPGGSKKDSEVIGAANELGLCMVFTGVRHFRH